MREATIYIPTYRRVGRQETWKWLSPRWRERAFLVARPEEVDPLRAQGFQVLECPETGIGNTRQWILDQHDIEDGGRRIVMMDDDLRFYLRRTDDPGKFVYFEKGGPVWDDLMEDLLECLDYVPLAGIVNRSGANRDASPYRLNTRLHDVLAWDLEVARAEGIRINRVPFMEDFDTSLQFLTRGYPTLALGLYCKGDNGSNTPGGCSEYRDRFGQAEAAMWMKETWPDYVTITTRPGWNGEMAGSRTDVRIAWSRAYRDGVEGRKLLGRPLVPEPTWSLGTLEV